MNRQLLAAIFMEHIGVDPVDVEIDENGNTKTDALKTMSDNEMIVRLIEDLFDRIEELENHSHTIS